METYFWGIKWPIPSGIDITLTILIILIVSLFFLALRYYYIGRDRTSQEHQQFLLKSKRFNLSNNQIKILSDIVKYISLKNPSQILERSAIFESAIPRYMDYLIIRGENPGSLTSICRDLIATYEKIYNPYSYRKQINNLNAIEDNIFIFFIEENVAAQNTAANNTVRPEAAESGLAEHPKQHAFIGKLTGIDTNENFNIKLLNYPKNYEFNPDRHINVFIWRSGDGEYAFNSILLNIDKKSALIPVPNKFERSKAVRPPDMDVNIECEIINIGDIVPDEEKEKRDIPQEILDEEKEKRTGLIFRLNIDEATVRHSQHLEYNILYYLNFEIVEFKMKILCNIIAERTMKKENIYYYTFKFEDMSEPAREILHKYITGL